MVLVPSDGGVLTNPSEGAVCLFRCVCNPLGVLFLLTFLKNWLNPSYEGRSRAHVAPRTLWGAYVSLSLSAPASMNYPAQCLPSCILCVPSIDLVGRAPFPPIPGTEWI